MERIIALIALYAALAPGAAHAQDDAGQRWKTCGLTDGRFWKEVGSVDDAASRVVKSAYLMGSRT
jgi:hypothetical protein